MLNLTLWRSMLGDEHRWRSVLEQGVDREFQETFRSNTHTGRPLCTDSFLSKLENQLDRRLRALPAGRPRKRRKGAK